MSFSSSSDDTGSTVGAARSSNITVRAWPVFRPRRFYKSRTSCQTDETHERVEPASLGKRRPAVGTELAVSDSSNIRSLSWSCRLSSSGVDERRFQEKREDHDTLCPQSLLLRDRPDFERGALLQRLLRERRFLRSGCVLGRLVLLLALRLRSPCLPREQSGPPVSDRDGRRPRSQVNDHDGPTGAARSSRPLNPR